MRNFDVGLIIIRVTVGGLLLLHGIDKVFNGIDFIVGLIEGLGLPKFMAYGVYIGEVVAPLLLLIGFRTRLASLFLVLNFLVIVSLVHSDEILMLESTGGWALELQALYMLGAVALFFMGAGKYAVSSKHHWD